MTSTAPNTYPPVLSEGQLSNLVFNVVDYRFYHGMLLKLGRDANSVKGVPIGVSLFPSLLPKSHFEKAQQLQLVYNKLYAAICEDEEWLAEALEGSVYDFIEMIIDRSSCHMCTDSCKRTSLLKHSGEFIRRLKRKDISR